MWQSPKIVSYEHQLRELSLEKRPCWIQMKAGFKCHHAGLDNRESQVYFCFALNQKKQAYSLVLPLSNYETWGVLRSSSLKWRFWYLHVNGFECGFDSEPEKGIQKFPQLNQRMLWNSSSQFTKIKFTNYIVRKIF